MIFKNKTKSYDLDMNNIPQHIAFIMDGNGRWAKKRKMPRTFGHHEGTKTIRSLALEASRLGVKAMTVYAFSTENFKRDQKEVDYIFRLPKEFFSLYLKELIENNVRIQLIGHLEMAPKETQDIINAAIEKTKDNTGLSLVFAFIYGGRDEIVQATKAIAQEYKDGLISMDDIDENLFENHLMTAGLPPVDLMIRTSGECRLSNYLLWQLSYAEFIFVDTLWPDFNEEELHKCIYYYQNRERRFGGVLK
ncbi:undecaprenyl diphosphate synthase [Kandleria vitulina]|uniref:Isoprenyl transferase n=1 Tax=Kandleria vitulina TaxID=1630 RepID=A0A1H2RBR4_9FIRM|nr:isoprenyl transferase [Kandleria vitulina]SDW16847.1 undecaprenyl diphosphate synthase [Kandleria vitulina]HAH75046.1 isoprenyl transferase [Kandleria vitulina]HCY53533.1 isoprenyl transferase [Kandleria vitulina]